MEEDVRPSYVITFQVEMFEFASFAGYSYSEYRMEPFAHCEIAAREYGVGCSAARAEIERRTYTALNLPVVPKTVGNESFYVRSLTPPC